VHTIVAGSGSVALLPVAGKALADLPKAGELFEVSMDKFSKTLPLVALDWRFGLKIPKSPQTKAAEHPGHGGEGGGQQPGDTGLTQSPSQTLLPGLSAWVEVGGIAPSLCWKAPTLQPISI
jgi:hypothetical protein